MDTYRDDSGALREQVEALRRELDETQRSLAEARALAGTHKQAARKLEGELMHVRPGTPRRAAVWVAAFFGLAFGVIIEAGISARRVRTQQLETNTELAICHEDLVSCRSRPCAP